MSDDDVRRELERLVTAAAALARLLSGRSLPPLTGARLLLLADKVSHRLELLAASLSAGAGPRQ